MKNVILLSQERIPTAINVGVNLLKNGINSERGNGYRAHSLYHQRGGRYTLVHADGEEMVYPTTQEAIDGVRSVVGNGKSIIQSHMYQPFSNTFTKASEDKSVQGLTGGNPLVYSAHYLFVYAALMDPDNQARGLERVWRNHKTGIEEYKAHTTARNIEGWMTKADRITYVSEHAKRVYDALYPESAHKSMVIPLCTDFLKYGDDPVVKRKASIWRNMFGDKAIILYAGRITKSKGAGNLIKAFQRLNKKYENIKLVMIGCGDDTVEVDNSAWELIENGDIMFTGQIKDRRDLAAIYNNAFVTVMPSYHETFSRMAIEAMSMGSPVIISDVDGPRDLFVRPNIAKGIKPGNPKSITNAIEDIFEKPEETRRMVGRALNAVRERFGPKPHVDAYLGLYEELL